MQIISLTLKDCWIEEKEGLLGRFEIDKNTNFQMRRMLYYTKDVKETNGCWLKQHINDETIKVFVI